jgi:hypothetical protein
LHRKKCWLDTVIQGLEQAIQSPEIRLIDAVEAAFKDGQTPRVDILAHQGSLLRALAAKVPHRSRAASEKRVDTSKQAA